MKNRPVDAYSVLPTEYILYRRGGKRALDLVLATVGILVLSPLMLLSAVAVFIESGWPIVFSQSRCGLNGNAFNIYKFRSMSTAENAEATGFDAGYSGRVTRVGRVLRRTKIDETLQLINVLVGDMSIIGPRPEVPHWVSMFPEEWALVHTVKPGMSDEASIIYRDEEEELSTSGNPSHYYQTVILPRKLVLYGEYVKSHDLHGDVSLILRTLKAVIF